MESLSARKLIRLSKSCIGDAEEQAVMGVLDREYLGMGAEVEQFEQALFDFFGRPVVCVVNGTAALHLALQACGIGPGDEVLVQSLTYVASFQAISATGATPVACDIDPATLTLDWRDAEKRLTPKTKAVMPVHYAGGVGALDEIYAFARKHGLRVIEDAAHAFGTVYQGKRVGEFGDIACFSFDGIKNITSGEGGCIVSDDPEVLQHVCDARLLGVEKDTENRFAGNRSWEFDVAAQGWRYHMSNIMAAIGIEQLKKTQKFKEKKQKLVMEYIHQLSATNQIKIVLRGERVREVFPHIFPIILGPGSDRDRIIKSLKGKKIQTGIHYQPNHHLTYYKKEQLVEPLTSTDAISSKILTLPLHAELELEDITYIATTLLDAINE